MKTSAPHFGGYYSYYSSHGKGQDAFKPLYNAAIAMGEEMKRQDIPARNPMALMGHDTGYEVVVEDAFDGVFEKAMRDTDAQIDLNRRDSAPITESTLRHVALDLPFALRAGELKSPQRGQMVKNMQAFIQAHFHAE